MKNKGGRGFRILESTADIGLELHGRNLEQLFENGIKGLAAIICGAARPDIPGQPDKKDINLEFSISYEDLLVDFLNELLYLVNEKLWLPFSGRVKLTREALNAKIKGNTIKSEMIETHVKAATFHNIKIEKSEDYRTEIIFDI